MSFGKDELRWFQDRRQAMSRPTEVVVAGDEATLAARVEKVLAVHPRSDVALGDCDPGDWCVE